jgi:hypothetical protein
MRLHRYIPLPLLLAFTCAASAQVKLGSAAAARGPGQQSGSISKTYDDTVRMLKTWTDSKKNADFARLFAKGNARSSDLLVACRSKDDEIASGAFVTLQLLGAPGLRRCADSMERRSGVLLLSSRANLTNAEFKRIDHWLAMQRTLNGYRCPDGDSPGIDDALVYALILDGSALSKSVLSKMLVIEKFCVGAETVAGEDLEQADSLIASAKEIGHDLKIEPDIRDAIRASAFFLPVEYRKDSEVELLARTDDRILLEVSYSRGPRCGRGYYVALRKDGPVWQYAVIRMWWIA